MPNFWGCRCCGTRQSGCQSCENEIFFDGFDGDLSSYSFEPCFDGTTNDYVIDSGKLSWPSVSSGSLYQTITTPPLDGLCVSVEAQFELMNGVAILFIGGVRALVISSSEAPFANMWISSSDDYGCYIPVFHDVDEIVTYGPIHRIKIQDTSGGAGVYSITYCKGVVEFYREDDVSLTLPDTLNIGVRNTAGLLIPRVLKWDNLKIATS